MAQAQQLDPEMKDRIPSASLVGERAGGARSAVRGAKQQASGRNAIQHSSSEPDLTLWGASTTRTMRAHWALHELGLDYQKRMVAPRSGELQTAEFRAVNSREKVPVLQDGNLTLAESAAIVNYLGDRYGAGSGLTPASGTVERGVYDQWCFFIMTELDAHTLYVIRKHGDLSALYGEAPAAIEAARQGFVKQIAGVDDELRQRGPHLLGQPFTGADISLTTCLDWAGFVGIPLSDRLNEYLERMHARPAYQSASTINYSISPDGTSR